MTCRRLIAGSIPGDDTFITRALFKTAASLSMRVKSSVRRRFSADIKAALVRWLSSFDEQIDFGELSRWTEKILQHGLALSGLADDVAQNMHMVNYLWKFSEILIGLCSLLSIHCRETPELSLGKLTYIPPTLITSCRSWLTDRDWGLSLQLWSA